MNKRPFYLIRHEVDCDGYTTYVDYLGVNAQAAIDRFKHLVEEIKQRYFLQYDNQQIFDGGIGLEGVEVLTTADIDRPGKCIRLGLNDDADCWISITIEVIHTGEFLHYQYENGYGYQYRMQQDNLERELMYKNTHPKAKF